MKNILREARAYGGRGKSCSSLILLFDLFEIFLIDFGSVCSVGECSDCERGWTDSLGN